MGREGRRKAGAQGRVLVNPHSGARTRLHGTGEQGVFEHVDSRAELLLEGDPPQWV
ncbi:hypothetical protein [Ktedonobacter robiniae]|uniref:Uncharacterized protein n=1 Tax=Ktedonobacter robiniae TaxID=2778365 RepID=A0ABQ3UK89_9CHLR|nr:hypothetical protein [Ktedonobacter robiniae]GHO53093.1 hypothetical protein KSB_15680 [Ktedonobacter robiniae]